MSFDRRHYMYPKASLRGFTLVELMVTLAVIGVLAALAAPSFNELVVSQRMKSMASDINASLTLARSEAIKRNKNVTLSPTTAGIWQGGWKIADPDYASTNIEVHPAFPGLIATGPDSVTYQSSGRVQGNVAPEINIGATGTSSQRCVSVDLSGRPYIKANPC